MQLVFVRGYKNDVCANTFVFKAGYRCDGRKPAAVLYFRITINSGMLGLFTILHEIFAFGTQLSHPRPTKLVTKSLPILL